MRRRYAGDFLVGCLATVAHAQPRVRHNSSSSEAGVVDENAYREHLIREILSRDKEIFELKRQHELSMLRVEQNQRRVLKDQEDRGMYYEQNCNVHTFDTVSVGLYTQRNTLYHTMSVERLRNVKLFVTVLVTLVTCIYFYYRYMVSSEWVYVEKPMKVLGSRIGALNELRAQREEEEEEQAILRSNLRG
ncbi:hypothetical protein DQ04_04861040 [Trypanosoma grayi]|uniref:hypothetical protein n=1 Tax=Trypanosoma grayi TaxID=71804 RepID=UPI0004F40680|nr:hypothetical protein DQ04_04861040 [Trypanosoma grayi]KEG09656.1 hypothetical protein DQ04_04861040 [Trypanosoma grayi]